MNGNIYNIHQIVYNGIGTISHGFIPWLIGGEVFEN